MSSDPKPSSSKSFTFAEPSPIKVGPQDYGTEDGSGVAQFTFCLPEEVVCSSLSISKEPSPVLTSSTTDISSSYNKMPDITAQMSYAKNPLTLRSGRKCSFKKEIKNPEFIQKIHILKISFLTKFTITKSQFSHNSQDSHFQNSHFQNPHFSQNSRFQNLVFHKIHIFQTSNLREFQDKKLGFLQFNFL